MSTLRQSYKSIYWCWKAMKQRTRNPKCAAYPNYGGRGVTMTHDWDEFESFLQWALKSGWRVGLDLDRIDNDGPYCPTNCRWATRRENTNNRRKTILLTVYGETLPLTEWSRRCGIPRTTIGRWFRKHGTEYASARIAEAIGDGYTPMAYGHDLKPVTHIESGRSFESVKSAAEYFGISASRLSTALNHRDGKTSVGVFVFA